MAKARGGRRSRGAPGTFSSRGGGVAGNSKFKTATMRTGEAKAWREHADERRAEVYRTDVPFAGEDRAPARHMTPQERVAATEKLKELRGTLGWTIERCAIELGWSAYTITRLCNRAGIVKGGGEKVDEAERMRRVHGIPAG